MEENSLECHNCGAKNENESEFCSFCHVQIQSQSQFEMLKDKFLGLLNQKQVAPDFQPRFGHLSAAYFNPPSVWFFNSDWIQKYLKLILVVFVALIILFFSIYYVFVSRPENNRVARFESIIELYKKGDNPDKVIKEIKQFKAAYPDGNEVKRLDGFREELYKTQLSKALNQAEAQVSYQLKIETYEFILKNYKTVTEDQSKNIKNKIKTYQANIKKAKLQLAVVEQDIEKQYFSAAIRKVKPILSSGKLLGELYNKAKDLEAKAYIDRVDYFLVKAQLQRAKKALNEAKAAKISSPEIPKLETKLKQLLKI